MEKLTDEEVRAELERLINSPAAKKMTIAEFIETATRLTGKNITIELRQRKVP